MIRNQQKRFTRLVLFTAIALFSIWLVNSYVSGQPPKPTRIAAALPPVNDPLLEDVDIMVWARDAAIATYTFKPETINRNLTHTANYFSMDGWRDFYNALRASHNLESIRSKRYSVTAKSIQVPQILARGVEGDTYGWRIQVPLEVKWSNDSGDSIQTLMVTMQIRRTNKPIDFSGPGVAIEKYVAIPVASSSALPAALG
ncbi:MAG: DotI/IcmL family type IV secretion protein [Pseudomonadota bacterium]|nr:DotI/IcmL family type IV secretion protein [Pseudomonadota bacterium]